MGPRSSGVVSAPTNGEMIQIRSDTVAEAGEYSGVQLEELRERISWLIRLRWVAVAGVVATVSLAPVLVRVRLHQPPLYAVTACLAVYNVILWAIRQWWPRATRGSALPYFANAQIALDLTFLTVLLHYSGGIENPFICYYVFHIVIASILLSRHATYLQVTLALALLTGMAGLEAGGVLRHYPLVEVLGDETLYRRPTYVFANLFATGTMFYFAAFMATSITARLRRREAEIVRLSARLRDHAADLGQAYDALRRAERVRSEYLYRVAHHLRSPLASVENLLAVVTEGRTGPVPDRGRNMLDRARIRVRNMLELARDLLVLSRTREASLLVGREAVDLAAVAKEAAHDLREQAAAASVSLIASVPEDIGSISADRESMVELVENLVSNAIKYTPSGGEVRLQVTRKDDHVEVQVSDTGMGIPPDEREKVFEEFYRASNVRETKREGTGLGLSIVKAIAEAHGGEVSMESELGAGTTFRVALPVAPPARTAAP